MKRFRSWLIIVALVAMALAIYRPTLRHEFSAFDDDVYVSNNAHIQGGLKAGEVAWAFRSVYAGYWIPLTWISYMLDVEIFGPGPTGFHITNMALHAANGVILFLVLAGMTGAVWGSALVAALFVAHPLHVESVAWITERKDVLSTFFGLLGLLGYLFHLRRPGAARYMLPVTALGLGLMSKPMLVTFPLLLLLLDGWPLGRWRPSAGRTGGSPAGGPRRGRPFRELVLEKAPFAAMSAAVGVLVIITQRADKALFTLADASLSRRLANAAAGYVWYILKMFWPRRLAVIYPELGRNLPVWQVLSAAGLLILLTAAALALARRRPFLATGWFWYLGSLAPVIGLVKVGLHDVADRFSYLPLIGLFLALAWLLAGFVVRSARLRAAAGIALAAALAVMVLASRRQAGYWQSSVSLFEHAVEATENNWLAYYNLGSFYFEVDRRDEAVAAYQAAIRANPRAPESYFNLAVIFMDMGNFKAAMALQHSLRKVDNLWAERLYRFLTEAREGRLKPQCPIK